MPDKPRRIKVFPVRDDDIMQCFLTSQTGFPFYKDPDSTNVMRRLRFKNLPDGHIITHGWYDAVRNCFMISVEHPSFEEVKHGEIPPVDSAEVELILCNEEGKYIKSYVEERKSWRDSPSFL